MATWKKSCCAYLYLFENVESSIEASDTKLNQVGAEIQEYLPSADQIMRHIEIAEEEYRIRQKNKS